MDGVVAVTFTEKAAGELKLRLREALEGRARASRLTPDDARAARGRAADSSKKRTSTRFTASAPNCCASGRSRPGSIRCSPSSPSRRPSGCTRARFARGCRRRSNDPPEGVRRALRRTSGSPFGGLEDSGPIERLRGAGWTLAGAPRLSAAVDAAVVRSRARHRSAARVAASPGRHERRRLVDSDNLYQSLDRVRRDSQQIRLEQSLGQRDLDAWESRLIDLSRDQGLAKTRKGYGAKYGSRLRADVLAARDAFYADLLQFRADADGDLAALLQSELQAPTARYQELKRRKGAARLRRSADLHAGSAARRTGTSADICSSDSRGSSSTSSRIRIRCRPKILLLLSADDGRCRIAGRTCGRARASCSSSAIRSRRFTGSAAPMSARTGPCAIISKPCGGRVLQLTTNFRSVPAIQRFVNRAFEQEMVADRVALQAEYVPLAERRASDDSQPALVALPVPAPYSTGRARNSVTGKAVEASLPDAVGAFIAWLVNESKWQVPERQADGSERLVGDRAAAHRRAVPPVHQLGRGHDAALHRCARRARHPASARRRQGVPRSRRSRDDSRRAGGDRVAGRRAVGVRDAQRLALRHRRRAAARVPSSLRRVPSVPHRRRAGRQLRRRSSRSTPSRPRICCRSPMRCGCCRSCIGAGTIRPVADTIAQLLDATRAHVGFMLRPSGEQALANVLHVAELARQYEAEGGISFRGFIDQLRHGGRRDGRGGGADRRGGERRRPPDDRPQGEGSGVPGRRARGSDVPTEPRRCEPLSRCESGPVRGAGSAAGRRTICTSTRSKKSRAIAPRASGSAYVAATRARDLLVVPAIGDEPWEGGWLDPLNRALYPPPGARQTAERAPRSVRPPSRRTAC